MAGFEVTGNRAGPLYPKEGDHSSKGEGFSHQDLSTSSLQSENFTTEANSLMERDIVVQDFADKILAIAQASGILPIKESVEPPAASITDSESKTEEAVAHALSLLAITKNATHRRLGEGHSVLAVPTPGGEKIWEIAKGLIAKGSFKKVKLASSEGQTAAYASIALVNIPEKGMTKEKIKRDTLQEIQVSCDCACDQVVQFKAITAYQSKKDPSIQKMGLLMEYCQGDELSSALRPLDIAKELVPATGKASRNDFFTDEEIIEGGLDPTYIQAFMDGHRGENCANLLGDSLLGLAHIHKCGYVHRDIKPNNIFVSFSTNPEGSTILHSKIGDFGFARHPKDIKQEYRQGKETVPGTIQFFSPEVLSAAENLFSDSTETREAALDSLANPKGDVWALGLTFYNMMTDDYPPWVMLPPMGEEGIADVVPKLNLTTVKEQCQFSDEVLANTEAYIAQYKEGGFESALPLCNSVECLNLLMLCPNPNDRPSSLECSRIFSSLRESGKIDENFSLGPEPAEVEEEVGLREVTEETKGSDSNEA
jgi:serine/threonine protein kinase